MPTKIRLQRHGRKKYPFYHIVIANSQSPRDGKFIEKIGSYNPNTSPATVKLKFDRALYWLQVGAQPTDTVKNILSREGVHLKKHLLDGVNKGAFEIDTAESRFLKWKKNKQSTSSKASIKNNLDIDIKQRGIIVIQSLKETERKTGDELEKDILQYKKFHDEFSFVGFHNAYTKQDFIKTLKDIELKMKNDEIFTLHFETHGGEQGIGLASGEIITWEEFHNCLRPINEKMNNLLLVILGMCKGAAILSFFEPEKRAPFLAIVGSHRNLSEDEVARGFAAFYTEYTDLLDINKGMKALHKEIDGVENPTSPTLWCFYNKYIFDAILDPERDPIHFQQMVSKVYENEKKKNVNITEDEVEKNIRNMLLETKNKYKDFYCFNDLYSLS